MATRFESSSSACSPMFIPPPSATESRKTLPAEDSALAGVMNSPLYVFRSIRQLQKIVTSCSNELQAGSTNQQYLVFLHVTNDQLSKIDHKRASIGNHIRMTHHTDTNVLIVKLMPSVKHELAHTYFTDQLTYQLIQMGIKFDGLLSNMAGSRCSGPRSSKEADAAYKPICRDHEIDWPTLVVESGLSEGLARLRVDARWWLVNSGGDVNIVIIISIMPAERSLRFEKWCLAPPTASLPITRANPNPNRPVAMKIQEICVAQNPATPFQPATIAPCTVTGGSLVLEFQSLYLRAPVAPESDVIFTQAILSEWANKFWHMTK